MHGGPSPGAPKGNRNAFKHGRYTAEAIARRREIDPNRPGLRIKQAVSRQLQIRVCSNSDGHGINLKAHMWA